MLKIEKTGKCPNCGWFHGFKSIPTFSGEPTLICGSCKKISKVSKWNEIEIPEKEKNELTNLKFKNHLTF